MVETSLRDWVAEAFRFNKFSDWVNGAGSLFEIAELRCTVAIMGEK